MNVRLTDQNQKEEDERIEEAANDDDQKEENDQRASHADQPDQNANFNFLDRPPDQEDAAYQQDEETKAGAVEAYLKPAGDPTSCRQNDRDGDQFSDTQ